MRVFHELLGVWMEIPEDPQRIISLAPDLTEILFRLELGERVVGISLYCSRPAEQLQGFPRVGAYLKVNEKQLASLQPDVVLTTLGAQRETTRKLLDAGYPVVAFPVPLTLWGILDNLQRMGALFRRMKQAQREVERLVQILRSLRGSLKGHRVYWEVDLGGPITAGRLAYVTDALHWLGLVNIYADRAEGYFTPDDAETRHRRPDVILYEPRKTRNAKDAVWREHIQSRLRLDVPVVVLPHDSLAHDGPALVDEVLPRVKETVLRFFRP